MRWGLSGREAAARYSKSGRSLARTSSMMKSGSLSMNRALRACRSENPHLIAQNYALGLGSGAAQRDGEPGMAGEVAALRDGPHERSPEYIEGFRRDDRHIARDGLLAALDRISIDVKDIATLHRVQASRPMAGASIHAWSSADRGLFASHCAMSSARL